MNLYESYGLPALCVHKYMQVQVHVYTPYVNVEARGQGQESPSTALHLIFLVCVSVKPKLIMWLCGLACLHLSSAGSRCMLSRSALSGMQGI